MAEEKNEELSMEDILSSIKDILTDDAQAKDPAAPAVPAAQPPAETPAAEPVLAAAPAGEDPVEDILELSPSMRIEEELSNPAEDINLDAELGDISPNLDDISLENAGTEKPEEEFDPEDILNSLPSLEEDKDLESDPFDLPPVSQSDKTAEGLSAGQPDENSWTWEKEDDESEPYIAAAGETAAEEETIPEVVAGEVADEETAAENVFVPEIDSEPLPEPEAPEFSESISESEAKNEPESFSETEIITENEAFPAMENQPVAETVPESEIPAQEQPETKAGTYQVSDVSGSEAIDVSASIISNFAKMFSSEGTPVKQEETALNLPEESVRDLGNASTTIEDVVAKVIRSIIGDEVAANWRKSADYDTLAREEIKAQTERWLNKNLPALVEKIVKQEIERVMAKVGSQD